MKIANVVGRACVVTGPEGDERVHDVAERSDGRFGPAPQDVFEHWPEFLEWAATVGWSDGRPVPTSELRPPSPAPRQVFAVGLNFRAHADEAGFVTPTTVPPVFTKFVSCLCGPTGEIELPAGGHTDWEVELVVVIGRRAHRVAAADALEYVAGYTLGQDISERIVQLAASPPQFSVGKSLPNFGPTGPWLVTLDEFADPNDVELGCAIDGETVQSDRTSRMIFSVPQLIESLSASVVLLPGDIVFAGTPEGVGMGRSPQRWLQPGEILTSWAAGIGRMTHRCVADR